MRMKTLRVRLAVNVLLQTFLDHPEHILLALHDVLKNSEERAKYEQVESTLEWIVIGAGWRCWLAS